MLFRSILFNAQNVIAVELLCAAQAIDFGDASKLGSGTQAAYKVIRSHVSKIEEDRVMHIDFNKIYDIIKLNQIVKEVEKVLGELKY